MKILQISLFYYPDKTGIAVTSTEVAEWFAQNNNSVEVISGPPFYPEWKIREEYLTVKKELINNVIVHRTKLFVPKKVSTISRLLHEFSFLFFVFFKMLQIKKPDVIVLVSPPLSLGLIAIFFKIIWSRKLLLNVKDLVPDAAIELSMLSNKHGIKILYILEKFVYKHSDKIASLGNGVLDRIKNKGINSSKLVYIPDTADPNLIHAKVNQKESNKFLTENDIKDEFIVLHSGNMGVKQGIDVIVNAAKLIADYPIKFYIVGDGVVKKDIVALANSYSLSNIKFLPLQPREWLADMYHAANLSLLTQRAEVVDIVVPSKLLSMMAAGSCVIASANSESDGAKIVIESECGSVIEPENPKALADEILRYYNQQEIIPIKKQNSKNFISANYDRDKIMQYYKEILEELTS